LEGSSVDNGNILLSVSSDWMDILEVLASGMIGSGGDSTKEHDVLGAASIDEDSVELDILDDGANYEMILPRFGTKFRWSLRSKVMGTSDHVRYSGEVGETTMTSWAVSFFFCLDS
jgi:hypothetical protein